MRGISQELWNGGAWYGTNEFHGNVISFGEEHREFASFFLEGSYFCSEQDLIFVILIKV